MNPMLELEKEGQAIWLDYIKRSLITDGGLKALVEDDGITGVTSNPSIFEQAINGSMDYDPAMKELLGKEPNTDVPALYEALVFHDIQMAADVLRPVYDRTGGADGFVSLELDPSLAYDIQGSIEEARRFWKAVDRPNLMIKVPATKEGMPIIETLIAEGINVNVTLMFSLDHYDAVAKAYINGLEKCRDPSKVASVASFFLSRIDTQVDKRVEDMGTEEAMALRGRIAVDSARLAYKRFTELFGSDRWKALEAEGARVQRPLWASTGTKNPDYSDVKYVEELIGPSTVNTLPPKTIDAFKDHGKVRSAIMEGWDQAEEDMEKLAGLGIDLDEITEKLQKDGAQAFIDSFNKLMDALEEKRRAVLEELGQ